MKDDSAVANIRRGKFPAIPHHSAVIILSKLEVPAGRHVSVGTFGKIPIPVIELYTFILGIKGYLPLSV